MIDDHSELDPVTLATLDTLEQSIIKTVRELKRETQRANLYRQLVSEALTCMDENDPDYDHMDIRSWIRVAKDALARHS